MFALQSIRSSLRRTLTPLRALAHQVHSSSTTGHKQEGTFYEFCTYYLKPSNVEEFLYNFKKNVHLRTAHSELVGYWSVGLGGRINTVFHIWKYDNYAHRAAVYKALAKDKEWQERFLIPNLPFIDKQESEITYLVPWCKLGTPPKEGIDKWNCQARCHGCWELNAGPLLEQNVLITAEASVQLPLDPHFVICAINSTNKSKHGQGISKHKINGVYELATFQMKPGGPALWGDAFERAVSAHANQGYVKLIGVFHAEFGFLNRVHVLWWTEDADIRAAGRHRAHKDPKVISAGELFQEARIIFRTSFDTSDNFMCFMKCLSSSGKCQLPRYSAEYVPDSLVLFTIEIVSY